MKGYKRHKKEIIKLGKLEGKDDTHLYWKSKSKALSWGFAYYVPVLLRDALRELAQDHVGCPCRWVSKFDDADDAVVAWGEKLKSIADKLDYASKITYTLEFLSQEDRDTVANYLAQECEPVFKKTEDGLVTSTLPPTPDYIQEIWHKEDRVAEDMHVKLKEALQELGEIWYDLWD